MHLRVNGLAADTLFYATMGREIAGYRGLKGGVSLAGLLARAFGVRNRSSLLKLTAAQVVGWAKAHYRRTGKWPTRESGAIEGVPGETWHGVDLALRGGYRGLPGDSSLGRLLREYRDGLGRCS